MASVEFAKEEVFGQQLVVASADLEKVIDRFSIGDARAAVCVRPNVRLQLFEGLPLDQHEPSASPFNLERLFRIGHPVAFQFVNVENAGQGREVWVVQNRPLLDPAPVDPLHRDTASNDSLVGLDHLHDVTGPKLLVCVDEQQMACVSLKKVMRDSVSGALHKALVAQKDAGQLVTVALHVALQLEHGLDVLGTAHPSIHWGSNNQVHHLLSN